MCEAAGLKTVDKKRKTEKRVQRAIAEQPIMEHAGANVNLTISSCGLVLTALESGRIIAQHDMPRISFASGGGTVSTPSQASHKSILLSVPRGIVDLYSALPWVTWEAVTVVEGIP